MIKERRSSGSNRNVQIRIHVVDTFVRVQVFLHIQGILGAQLHGFQDTKSVDVLVDLGQFLGIDVFFKELTVLFVKNAGNTIEFVLHSLASTGLGAVFESSNAVVFAVHFFLRQESVGPALDSGSKLFLHLNKVGGDEPNIFGLFLGHLGNLANFGRGSKGDCLFGGEWFGFFLDAAVGAATNIKVKVDLSAFGGRSGWHGCWWWLL